MLGELGEGTAEGVKLRRSNDVSSISLENVQSFCEPSTGSIQYELGQLFDV
jgi:hypothetical protein